MTNSIEERAWGAYFGGRYLNADAVGEEGVEFEIDRAVLEEIEDPEKKTVKEKLVIYFTNSSRPWVPCKTTAAACGAMWGDKLKGWRGQWVTLYKDPTIKIGPKAVGGIRVRGSRSLTEPLPFKYKAAAKRRPEEFLLVPTGDPLALFLAEQRIAFDSLAAHLAANPVPRKNGASMAEIPTDPQERAGFARWLRGTQGAAWVAGVSREQQPADAAVEGEE